MVRRDFQFLVFFKLFPGVLQELRGAHCLPENLDICENIFLEDTEVILSSVGREITTKT